jgi:hypothetical protein
MSRVGYFTPLTNRETGRKKVFLPSDFRAKIRIKHVNPELGIQF